MSFDNKKKLTSEWFKEIRNKICNEFVLIEKEFIDKNATLNLTQPEFKKELWKRQDKEAGANDDLGGGEMSVMSGNVFESVAVNISTVYGTLSEKLFLEIKKSQDEFQTSDKSRIDQSSLISKEERAFFATGISLIAHMQNPHVPAVHFNTRFISNGSGESIKDWFGGGYDLTPLYKDQEDYDFFHMETKNICDKHDESYYPKFKKQCDEYFYLPHRQEPRGIGGIFYDYLNTGSFDKDFNFTKDVGLKFLEVYASIVRKNMFKSFSEEDREKLFLKRGRYVEFNLLYDRGTRFGLLTGGNTHSILSSLPPIVKWRNEGLTK